MKRANIIAKGKVQKVGYRDFVQDNARELGITGYVENLEDGNVKVVCEGEEEGITGLISSVKENPPSFASIEGMDVTYEDYRGEFSGFERRGADVPGEEEMDEMEWLRVAAANPAFEFLMRDFV